MPFGVESAKYKIHELQISNVSQENNIGNYWYDFVSFKQSLKTFSASGEIIGYDRAEGGIELVRRALNQTLDALRPPKPQPPIVAVDDSEGGQID